MSIQKIKNYLHLIEAIVATFYFRFPSRKIRVIGVTGTDGKTTTTHLIYHILQTAGKKTSMISTVYAKIGGREYDTGLHTTTPRPFDIQHYLRKSIDNGDDYFVLETTSHALDQNRVWGVHYAVSVVTNITREHLDYHVTYENYVSVKTKLLQMSDCSIINRDDQSYDTLRQYVRQSKLSTYSLKQKADYILPPELPLSLKGEYNRQNILAAYSVCKVLKIDDKTIKQALKTFSPPKGRLNIVYDKEFKVIIDFAHTSNSIDNVLQTVKDEYVVAGGRIIHVFGSAGLRDFQKRPHMGKASGKYANIVILTEEDYRTENIYKICREIAEGLIKSGFTEIPPEEIKNSVRKKIYAIEINREKAIRLAIETAKPTDVVIMTGKSHEKSLARGKKEYPWDEYGAVKNALFNRSPERKANSVPGTE